MRKREVELRNYLGTNCSMVEMLTETGKKDKFLQEIQKMFFGLFNQFPVRMQFGLNLLANRSVMRWS